MRKPPPPITLQLMADDANYLHDLLTEAERWLDTTEQSTSIKRVIELIEAETVQGMIDRGELKPGQFQAQHPAPLCGPCPHEAAPTFNLALSEATIRRVGRALRMVHGPLDADLQSGENPVPRSDGQELLYDFAQAQCSAGLDLCTTSAADPHTCPACGEDDLANIEREYYTDEGRYKCESCDCKWETSRMETIVWCGPKAHPCERCRAPVPTNEHVGHTLPDGRDQYLCTDCFTLIAADYCDGTPTT